MPRRRTVDPGQLNLFAFAPATTSPPPAAPRTRTDGALALALFPEDTPVITPPPAAGTDRIGDALAHAAHAVFAFLKNDPAIDLPRAALRDAMDGGYAHAGLDPAWKWQDAYDVCEAAQVLWLLDQAAGPHDPPLSTYARLDRIEQFERRLPTQSVRSEEQLRYQQFSTPLPLAYVMGLAAHLCAGDVLLEPSAGTGILLAAACYAGIPGGFQARPGALLANELAPRRAALLQRTLNASLGQVPVSGHDAAQIDSRLDTGGGSRRPTVVIANPPFSRTAGRRASSRAPADVLHLAAACRTLQPGGRLVALTAAGRDPALAAWRQPLEQAGAAVTFSCKVAGNVYRKRGTTFETRLTVWDRIAQPARPWQQGLEAESPAELLALLIEHGVADRPPLERKVVPLHPAGAGPDADARPRPVTPPPAAATLPGIERAPASRQLDYRSLTDRNVSQRSDASHQPWRPAVVVVDAATRHPTALVESAAMAAVSHPEPSYRPFLPAGAVAEGLLSDAQIESAVLCGEAHDSFLKGYFRLDTRWDKTLSAAPDGAVDPDRIAAALADDPGLEFENTPVAFRRGWFLGDGTGCGKGRQIAAVAWDNFARGRTRALWLSQTDKLIEDARRDWQALGGARDDVIPLWKYPQGRAIAETRGILFATYASLRQPGRGDKPSRLRQIVDWLAAGDDEAARHAFEGLVVFDESHALAGAAGRQSTRGRQRPSAQGIAGLRLQNALPQARVVYVSATGASTLDGLAYARRLGLWSSGITPFRSREEFVTTMEQGGVAALEVIARDLKALGGYQARALSYDGVEIDILEHTLSEPQRRIYDAYANGFKVIHRHIRRALEDAGAVREGKTLNKDAKANALSVFESTKQRFFSHLLCGMKCPSLIRAVEEDIEAGRVAVVQLSSTGEALMERRLAEIPASEWSDLSVDLTPRDGILAYLEHAFPVQLQEPYTDAEGNEYARPAHDADGRAILCAEAVAARDAMIESLAALPPVPTALDQIVHHFGEAETAEVTGRSRRIVRLDDGRLALKARPASANLTEADAFQGGDKNLLVFSMAGGTGRSYHAQKDLGDTRRRVHYLLEPGWRADVAIQGLGRTHRTHQSSAPVFRPVATDVKGERRFIATIASRLDALGAITRGQRRSQGQVSESGGALFRDADDMESPYAKAALRNLYHALYREQVPNWPLQRFQEETGLSLVFDSQLREDLPPMSRFLNRLLALPISEQNELFAQLEGRIESKIEEAKETGAFETGVETLRAHSLTIMGSETLANHPTGADTSLVHIRRREPFRPLIAARALAVPGALPVRNQQSGNVAARVPAVSFINEEGGIRRRVRLLRPNAKPQGMDEADFARSQWQEIPRDTWERFWEAEIAALPAYEETDLWLACGLLLPVWDRISADTMKVRRLVTDDGTPLIGRLLGTREAQETRSRFGLAGGLGLTPQQAWQAIWDDWAVFRLASGRWRVTPRRVMDERRLEIEGPDDRDLRALKEEGCVVEVIRYRARVFVPDATVFTRVADRWGLEDGAAKEGSAS